MNNLLSISIITIFLLIVAVGIIILVLVYQKRQLQYIAEKQQLKVIYDKEILESRLEIQEQTFKNISQELHDNMCQSLTLAKLHINTMNFEQPLELQDKVITSRNIISKVIQDLRDLSKSLHTDHIKESGLSKSIEYELEMIRKTGAYEVQLDVTGDPFRLEDQQELILFRIAQEALHNIMKHAKATIINVIIIFDAETFTLKIKDNGVGFDASPLESNNYDEFGLGLRNMYNRAKIINTDFKLTSTIHEGTVITLTLPSQILKL
jgi:two-component system NarL family sensor kinase